MHEALTHRVDDSVTETTVVAVYQPGYRFAGRVLRPARVAVARHRTPDVTPTDNG